MFILSYPIPVTGKECLRLRLHPASVILFCNPKGKGMAVRCGVMGLSHDIVFVSNRIVLRKTPILLNSNQFNSISLIYFALRTALYRLARLGSR